ncbi:MAG: DUF6582 domain-containing protein [Candidatus Korobacteraceae bacterium]
MLEATWNPTQQQTHGKLDAANINSLPESAFAFPKKRKEPMLDASHVRNAIARFDQVKDVTDSERDEAFVNIKKAANHFGVVMRENNWRELMTHSQSQKKAS